VFFGKHEVKSQRVLPSSSLLSDGRGQARPQFHLPLEGNPNSETPLNRISFFIAEPHLQRGLTPSLWLAISTKISALQALLVQCQESPGPIIMVNLDAFRD